MKKHIILSLMLIMLTACSRSKAFDEKDLQGTWVRTAGDSTSTWIFDIDGGYREETKAPDGEGTVTVSTSGKYELDGKKLKLDFPEYGTSAEYTVTLADGVMTWSDGKTTYTLEKK